MDDYKIIFLDKIPKRIRKILFFIATNYSIVLAYLYMREKNIPPYLLLPVGFALFVIPAFLDYNYVSKDGKINMKIIDLSFHKKTGFLFLAKDISLKDRIFLFGIALGSFCFILSIVAAILNFLTN